MAKKKKLTWEEYEKMGWMEAAAVARDDAIDACIDGMNKVTRPLLGDHVADVSIVALEKGRRRLT